MHFGSKVCEMSSYDMWWYKNNFNEDEFREKHTFLPRVVTGNEMHDWIFLIKEERHLVMLCVSHVHRFEPKCGAKATIR